MYTNFCHVSIKLNLSIYLKYGQSLYDTVIEEGTLFKKRWIVAGIMMLFFISLSGCAATSSTVDALPPAPNASTPASALANATPTTIAMPSPMPVPATPTSLPISAEPAESEIISEVEGAGNADVTFVEASLGSNGSWTFTVTVSHPDTGWEDYADGWDVVLPDGTVLKPNPDDPFTRLLLHPHETEQPFTRSQSTIVIPADVTLVTVRAHDLVDGWGGQVIAVDLTQAAGAGFEVRR
jgi:hypothetical protein